MIFYNGFNLLVDFILIGLVSVIAYRIGHRDGFLKALNKYRPPF